MTDGAVGAVVMGVALLLDGGDVVRVDAFDDKWQGEHGQEQPCSDDSM